MSVRRSSQLYLRADDIFVSESKTILEINNILIINHFIDFPKNSRLLPLSINTLPKRLTYGKLS